MAKTATAEQQARQRTREWRTRQAAEQAEQDKRINAALAGVLTGQQQVEVAEQALAQAHAAHTRAVEAAGSHTAVAVNALRDEGLTAEQIAELSGLTVADVRRALKASTAGDGSQTAV